MRYNILTYLVGEGFSNVFKNKKSTVASLGIMCATMIIFGVFLAISQNVNNFVKEIEAIQGIQVFIDLDATDEEIEKVGEELDEIDGINTKQFVSKEQAVVEMENWFEDKAELIEGLTDANSIFPASYIITLTDLNLSSQVQEKIEQLDNIKDIRSRDEVVSALIKIANGIKIVTGVILALLILISVFIISNTVKLTVHARRKEISIMKYVGATNSFIRWPFIVEGLIIGVAAGIISIVIIGSIYSIIAENIVNTDFMKILNIGLVSFSEMFNLIASVYLILGIGIGALGSSISMRKYLKV